MRFLHSNNKGFSLVELMIVMALVAIVATLAIPSYRYLTSKTKMKLAVQQLMHVIEQAKELAIHYQAEVIVCPSQTGKWCGGGWEQGQLIAFKESRRGISAFPPLAQGLRVEWRSNLGHNQFLEFTPEGLPAGQWGSFWLSGEEQLRARITMNAVGHIGVSEAR